MLSARTPNAQNLESWSGRCLGALLMFMIAGLIVACSEPVSLKAITPNTPTNGNGAGEAVLAWDPPASASGLAGYRIYYGTNSGTYLQSPGQGVPVTNGSTYTVTGLQTATTYYFAVTAYDSLNNESGFSNEVSKPIP